MTQPQSWADNISFTYSNAIPSMKRKKHNVEEISIKKARLIQLRPTKVIRLRTKKDVKEFNGTLPLKSISTPLPPRSPSTNCHVCHRIGTTINCLAACQNCGGSCCSVCQRTCLRTRPIKVVEATNEGNIKLQLSSQDGDEDEDEDDDEGCGRIICKSCSAIDDDYGVLCIRCTSDTQSPASVHSASPHSV